MAASRGPQVVLEGYARTVARGGAGKTMRDNIAAMDALVIAGVTPDGNTVDGKTRTGNPAYDHVVAQFPREELSGWEVPAPLLSMVNAGSAPFVQNDINPALHLSRWAVPGPKKVVIIGDSTSTDLPSPNYTLDPTMTIWGALKTEITRRNPHCKFMFVNRGINSSNWAHPMESMNDRNPDPALAPAPDWYTDRNKIWLDYVRDDQPDTLFVLLGTNASQSGLAVGSSVAKFINDFFIRVNAWVKVPDVILITNKIGNPAAGDVFLQIQEAYKSMASFLRTFARTNGNGYTAFPRVGFFGLLDLGRHYAARALGKDLAFQYLQKVPAAIHAGYTMVGPYTDTATTLGSTTDGDLRLTLLFHNAGGTGMYNALGVTGFFIGCSPFFANRLQITLTSGGIWTGHYQTDGTNLPPGIASVNYSPPAGDVTLTLTLKGEVVQLWLNGTLVMDIQAPRLIAGFDVEIGSVLAPLGPMIVDVTEFDEGIGIPSFNTLDPGTAFGSPGGPQAGNDINHPSSSTVASVDYPVIAATNWSAPQPTAQQLKDDKVQIYTDAASSANTATTAEEILKQTSLQSNLLINVGDTLEIEAWGNCAATTDNKTMRIRWGGLAGAAIVSLNATSASSLRWHARATLTKSAANVQVYGGDGSVLASTTLGTSGGQAGLPDTQPITACITSQNSTTAAAASITCECFRVALIKAPGT